MKNWPDVHSLIRLIGKRRIGCECPATVYSKPVVVPNVSRVSFNGPRGVTLRPTAVELANARGRHVGPVSAQLQQQKMASHEASLRASVNHGEPSILATTRAGEFGTRASIKPSTAVTANAGNRRQSARVSAKAEERTSIGLNRKSNMAPIRRSETRLHATAMRPTHELRNTAHTTRQSIQDRPALPRRETVRESARMRANTYGPAPERIQQVRRQEDPRGMNAMPMHSDASLRVNGGAPMQAAPAPRREERRPPDRKPRTRDHGGG